MLDQEFIRLVDRIQARKCEEQTIEVKAAARGCPAAWMKSRAFRRLAYMMRKISRKSSWRWARR